MKRFYLFCKRSVFNSVLGIVREQHPNALDVYKRPIRPLNKDDLLEVVGYLPIEMQNKIQQRHTEWFNGDTVEILWDLEYAGYDQRAVHRLHSWINNTRRQKAV